MFEYGSHLGPLCMAVCATKGPVLELGMGMASTVTLHWLCQPDRQLVSVEENPDWFMQFAPLHSPVHQMRCAPDTDKFLDLDLGQWSVALIDHGGPQDADYSNRIRAVDKLKNTTEVLVLHDTNDFGRYEKLDLSEFKHVWTFKPEGLPWTTVASQTLNMGALMHKAMMPRT